MENWLQNKILTTFFCVIAIVFTIPTMAQKVPSDLMDNCKQWKITYPTGEEDKTLCSEANNEFFYVNDAGDAIVFRTPIRSDNGTTPKSDNIRSELREREPDGSVDVYWTTEGSHLIYVKQAITHLPINKRKLVATQIHGNKEDGIDDSMVLRLEGTHLFLSFNGGKLRDNVTISTNYTLGTVHEVIFNVINGKHYCYYSEDGNLLNAYNNGNVDKYLVKADGNDYVMDLNYDQSYFKVGNYTQSNAVEEGSDTDNPENYGEVLVYDFFVKHGDVAVSGVTLSPAYKDLLVGNTYQLSASVSPEGIVNSEVNYSTSNSAVATVDVNGLVTAVSKGSAIITVTTSEGGFTNSSTINVVEATVGSNLALNKPIIGTGTPDGENVVSNLVDGLIATRWSVSGYPQAATVDLGEIYAIERTELVAYTDRDYKYTIAVATSENGPFTQIVDRSENTSPATELNPNINIFSVIEARFVKITVTGSENYTGDWISLLEFRVFGISISEDDDDNDGVLNTNDKCPNTSVGTSVDANGCALLESNNFKIEVLGETCSGKNNGKIVIAAAKSQDYTLTYNSETFSFTSGKILENISPGTYSFCIEVIGVTSPYCYTVVIPEAVNISGKSILTNKQLYITISDGTLPYNVVVNGNLQFKVYENDFNLEVRHGDLVEVKTAVECEGVYAKKIDLFNTLTAYPNPSKGLFLIPIETNHKTVEISVFNTVSKLVLSKTYNVINSKVQLDLTHKPRGIYFVKVHLNKDYIFKVVKH